MTGVRATLLWSFSVTALLLALFATFVTNLALGATSAPHSPDFASSEPVLDISSALAPYHASGSAETDGSLWYLMTAANQSVRPVTRILLADQPVDSSLRILPERGRASVRQVATSDVDVVVENAHAYGRYAFQVTMPPATTAELAIRLANAGAHPRVSAWLEPALAAHNRELAVLFAAVAGLIAASLAIMTGLAVMTGHAAPRWAAAVLLGVLLVRLSAAGVFDAIGVGRVGGPYGVSAMLAGLTLAAGVLLTDTIAPVDKYFSRDVLRWAVILLVGFSAFALVGVPGTMLASDILVVIGTALIAAWLVHAGLGGAQAARVAAPSAAVFALVTTAAAVAALGGIHGNAAAPGVIGGFAATGAVLLALAVAAGEGIAILPARRTTPAPLPHRSPSVLREETVQALTAIGASYQGVFEIDLEREIVKLSPEAAALLGFQNGAEVFSADDWRARVHPDDLEVYRDAIERFRTQKGLAFRVEFRVQTENGDWSWLELRASGFGEGETVERYLGLVADVTTRKESEAQPFPRARDALTGLRNRVGLIEDIERLGGNMTQATLALIDIDRFKSVHASLGDAGGDSVLVGIARRLLAFGSDRAAVFRTGGDGFAMLFAQPEMNALAIGERIVAVLNEPHEWEGRSAFAPASVGLALGRDAADPFDLIKNAELGLRKAKREGGACARLHGRGMQKSSAALDEVALETELRRSLAQDEIALVYQPIMRLSDGCVAGFEALLRWNHPERGVIAPGEFIPHAEQTGFVVELGRFALSRAAADLGRWQRMFPVEPALFISVNVSRRQLRNRELERLVMREIAHSGIKPGTLKLELTESAVGAGERVVEALRRLRGCGASLAIDDFGTGLSTLSQLKNVPFDTVKVDKSFLARGASQRGSGATVLRSIVNLAHELGRAVVLEGVENERDARWLKEIGCEFAQGFYFAAPLAPDEVPSFIAARRGGIVVDAESPQSGMAGVGGKP